MNVYSIIFEAFNAKDNNQVINRYESLTREEKKRCLVEMNYALSDLSYISFLELVAVL